MTRRPLLRTWFEAPEHYPLEPFLRIRSGMTPTRLCLALIGSAGWYAVAGCLLLICYNVAAMLLPVVLGVTIDRGIAPVAAGEPWPDVVGECLGWAGVLVALYVVMNLSFRFGGRVGWYALQRARHDLSDRVLARVLDTRGMSGPGRLPGTLLSVVTLDVQRACQALYVAVYPVGELVAVTVAAVSLFLIHAALGIAVLVGAALLLGVMTWVGGPLMERSEAEQERIADATATATDIVSGYRVVTGIHAQGAAVARFRRVSRSALDGTLAARTALSLFEGISTTLTGLFSAAVVVGAAVLAFHGSISIGELIAAAGVAQALLVPLQSLVGEAGSTWTIALASAGRILDVLDTPGRTDSAGRRTSTDGSAPVLSASRLPLRRGRLDLDVRPGEFVVLELDVADAQALTDALSLTGRRPAGAPDAGLADDPAAGRTDDGAAEPAGRPAADPAADPGGLARHIRFRGVPLVDIDPDLLRACVLVAPHQAELFEGSVLDNVIPVDESGAGPARARAALTAAHCESFQDQLPDGYATSVGERGRRLSGGQRQRIALARAVAADPPVLVLHEPTNAVDSVSEATIAARVRQARRGRTTVVISASAAFRSVADRVVRLHPAPVEPVEPVAPQAHPPVPGRAGTGTGVPIDTGAPIGTESSAGVRS